MKPTYVALDLETTGLDADTDSIIEIGAVRFDDEGEIERFHTLVNPRRPLPRAVQNLTGISERELEEAPPLEVVAQDLERILRGAAIVGHNVTRFDLPVLDQAAIAHGGAIHDTNELALILLPGRDEYSLEALCRDAGIVNESAHRALSDAEASRELFRYLQSVARGLPRSVVSQVAEWLAGTPHNVRGFFAEISSQMEASGEREDGWRLEAPSPPPPLRRSADGRATGMARALELFDAIRTRRELLPEFEERAEQREMAEAVARAFEAEQALIVEAGTGTGKSLAYLAPAAAHSLATGERVVVSTATINLQEQLLRKDLPVVGAVAGGRFQACQLKGRRNYLCLNRFHALRQAGPQSEGEALLASRILIWLTKTQTGDRSELRLTQAEEAVWSRLSADGAECTASNSPYVVDGTCFLQRARREAEGSHVVVVNHSLLLSNAAVGGSVLPPYERLVIDEAHHLEEEATRQFGFVSGEREMAELLGRCEGLAPQLQAGLRTLTLALGPHAQLTEAARGVQQAAAGVRPRLQEFSQRLVAFLSAHSAENGGEQRMLITRGSRAQPDWSDVEIAWENLRLTLEALTSALKQQASALTADGAGEMVNIEILRSEVDLLLQEGQERALGLASAIEEDDPERIVWIERARSDGTPIVSWVPLAVDGVLQERLYADLRTLVLTGATLASGDSSAGGSRAGSSSEFAYIQQRLGLMDAETLALGSPFDYSRAALVLVPSDMPEPNEQTYMQQLATTVTEVITASQGRALVLFTSHSALRTVHEMTVEALKREGVLALAQGVDGSPRQLVRALQSTENCAVYGTSSFWEGVDVRGEALSLLVMARLPFHVPTEPVFAARSATYDDPFSEYTLPQAVLRFKQGFGRLIRSRTDRGVMVVLDRRITSRSYGQTFLGALPPCTMETAPVRSMAQRVAQWLAAAGAGNRELGTGS